MSRIEALDDALAQLTDDETAHVIRLVTAWGMLADFCFADLVLYLPIGDRRRFAEYSDAGHIDDARFVMVNHVRPSTSPTIYHSDLIGEVRTTRQRPLVTRSYLTGEVAEGEIDSVWLDSRVRVRCIPVRHRSHIIGVLARESATTLQRQRGELEATYVGVFERFATMISEGSFPFADEDEVLSNPPRVGDGVVVVDRDGVVDYALPNAVSALVRAGADGNLRGATSARSAWTARRCASRCEPPGRRWTRSRQPDRSPSRCAASRSSPTVTSPAQSSCRATSPNWRAATGC